MAVLNGTSSTNISRTDNPYINGEIYIEEGLLYRTPIEYVPDDSDELITIGSDNITLSTLAFRYYGNSKLWYFIWEVNDAVLDDPFTLPVGTTLRIPTPARKNQYVRG